MLNAKSLDNVLAFRHKSSFKHNNSVLSMHEREREKERKRERRSGLYAHVSVSCSCLGIRNVSLSAREDEIGMFVLRAQAQLACTCVQMQCAKIFLVLLGLFPCDQPNLFCFFYHVCVRHPAHASNVFLIPPSRPFLTREAAFFCAFLFLQHDGI